MGASIGITSPAAAQDADQVLKALDDVLPGDLIHNPLNIKWETGGNDVKSKLVNARR